MSHSIRLARCRTIVTVILSGDSSYLHISRFLFLPPLRSHAFTVTLSRSTHNAHPSPSHPTAHPPRTNRSHCSDSAGMLQCSHALHDNYKALTSFVASTLPSHPQNHINSVNRQQWLSTFLCICHIHLKYSTLTYIWGFKSRHIDQISPYDHLMLILCRLESQTAVHRCVLLPA